MRTVKNTLKQLSLALVMAGLVGTTAHAQIQVESGLTLEQYVNDVLLGNSGVASNISFVGSSEQIGYLTGGDDALGFETGLIMSTEVASGTACGTDFCIDCFDLDFYDADLLEVANSVPPLIGQSFSVNSVNDGCVLEFDFIAASSELAFEFLFGSDEYGSYENTQYNDVFACFLSGPGISGGFDSPEGYPEGAINIAVVPNSEPELPITISSVNASLNSEYYVDNLLGTNPCLNGYTVPIVAEHELICGESYHVKLAIADGSDTALESVFIIRQGSFDAGSFDIQASMEFELESEGNNALYEDCGIAELVLDRGAGSDITTEQTVYLGTTGTAENGEDYGVLQPDGSLLPLPSTISLPAGVESVSIQISAAIDDLPEGTEMADIFLSNVVSCDSSALLEYSFSIVDEPEPLTVSGFSAEVCGGNEIEVGPTVSGGYGQYTFGWMCPEGNGEPSLLISPESDWSCFVFVGDTCSLHNYPVEVEVAVDVLEYPELQIEINEGDSITVGCSEPALITTTANGGDGDYTYQWYNQNNVLLPVNSDSSQFELAAWMGQVDAVVVEVSDGCGSVTFDAVYVDYDLTPLVVTVDSLIEADCFEPFEIAASVEGEGPFSYYWTSDGEFLGFDSTLFWSAEEDMTLTLQVADQCGQVEFVEISITTDCGDYSTLDCVVVDLNEGVLIPDATTNCFYSNVQVDSAYGTAVVDSSTNLGFFVNMEHSYMGDLIITYTCPNGQSITVHEQGGGGTNLGVPDQGDGTGPGVGWYYAWSPLATNGTWVDNSANAGILPAGTYESVDSFTQLEGCPISGTWSLEVCDLWGADDGYVFEWGLDFGDCQPETGCTDLTACNFDPSAVFDDGSCVFPGCTDPASCNYDPEAGCDDGSCLPFDALAGCMDQSACNYNPNAVCPDDSCIYPLIGNDCEIGAVACDETTTWNVELQRCECSAGPDLNDCPSDLNSNGLVEVTDLLVLLGDFGLECEE